MHYCIGTLVMGAYVLVGLMKRVMTALKILHWIGVAMVLVASYLYLGTDAALEVKGMLVIAVLGGLGLVMMSPYPVVLVLEWAKRQSGA